MDEGRWAASPALGWPALSRGRLRPFSRPQASGSPSRASLRVASCVPRASEPTASSAPAALSPLPGDHHHTAAVTFLPKTPLPGTPDFGPSPPCLSFLRAGCPLAAAGFTCSPEGPAGDVGTVPITTKAHTLASAQTSPCSPDPQTRRLPLDMPALRSCRHPSRPLSTSSSPVSQPCRPRTPGTWHSGPVGRGPCPWRGSQQGSRPGCGVHVCRTRRDCHAHWAGPARLRFRGPSTRPASDDPLRAPLLRPLGSFGSEVGSPAPAVSRPLLLSSRSRPSFREGAPLWFLTLQWSGSPLPVPRAQGAPADAGGSSPPARAAWARA